MTIHENPDTEYAAEVRRLIKNNNGYCPCKLDKNADTKCKCKDFREQVKSGVEGYCHCGLWFAKKGNEYEGRS